MIGKYADLFKNEHMMTLNVDEDTVNKFLHYFVEKGILEVSEDKKTVKIVNKERSMTYMNFFS